MEVMIYNTLSFVNFLSVQWHNMNNELTYKKTAYYKYIPLPIAAVLYRRPQQYTQHTTFLEGLQEACLGCFAESAGVVIPGCQSSSMWVATWGNVRSPQVPFPLVVLSLLSASSGLTAVSACTGAALKKPRSPEGLMQQLSVLYMGNERNPVAQVLRKK